MRAAWAVGLFLSSIPRSVHAGALTGTVVDPQRLVVVGAEVELRCGDEKEITRTDQRGQFRFPTRSAVEECVLSVHYPGLADFEQVVGRAPGVWRIELPLGRVEEASHVSAPRNREDIFLDTSLASVSLSERELDVISDDTPDLLSYAKALAGAPSGPDSIHVDGLPSGVKPPPETIARISVNADPFSAEYAEIDETLIQIETKAPDRRLRFHFGGDFLGVGGSNILATKARSAHQSAKVGVTGPVPLAPLTFSLHASLGRRRNDQPIVAVGFTEPFAPAPTSHDTESIFFGASYLRSEALRGNFSLALSRARGSNANVGGITLPEAGIHTESNTHEARASVVKTSRRATFRLGTVLSRADFHQRANSTSLGIGVLGSFMGGGALLSESKNWGRSWLLKGVVESASGPRSWRAGMTIARSTDTLAATSSPYGLIQFETLRDYLEALQGRPTGTWFGQWAGGEVRHSSTTAAPFIETELRRSSRAVVRTGLRADYQSGDGVLLSPRLFVAAKLLGFRFSGGGGIFVQDWPNDVLTEAAKNDGVHQAQFLATDVPLTDLEQAIESRKRAILSRLAPSLTRPRNLMMRVAAERGFGQLVAGLEYIRREGWSFLGSRRLATESGWLDVLESQRRSRASRLHARLRYRFRQQSLVAHYEWVDQHDDTDGPFSFPERADDIRAEWASSTGISPHNFVVVGSFKLPAAVSLSLVTTARSPAPYNITSSADPARNGLYNHRAGRSRNSGLGPSYKSVALYAHRSVKLPGFRSSSRAGNMLDVGVQADNLLANKNYVGFGSVLGSPLFGRPSSALPGRSIRFWVRVAN